MKIFFKKNTQKNIKNRLFVGLLLISFMFGVLTTINPFTSQIIDDERVFREEDDSIDDTDTRLEDLLGEPSASITTNDPWWNASFQYRRLINVSNPYWNTEAKTFTEFLTHVTINYTDLVENQKMNPSLKDIRIIKDSEIQQYCVIKNFNYTNYVPTVATIYFNVSISNSDQKLYLYYGNLSESIDYPYQYRTDHFDLHRWGMDGGTDETKVYDCLGMKNGTFTGTAWTDGNKIKEGQVGDYALEFNSAYRYVTIDPGIDLENEAFTLAWWENPRQTSWIGPIIEWEDPAATYDCHIWHYNSYDRLFINTDSSGNTNWPSFYQTSDVDTWVHVAFVYDGSGNLQIYKNGVAFDTPRSFGSFRTQNEKVYFGHRKNDNSRYLRSYLDDFRIYRKALTDNQISELNDLYELSTELHEEQGKYSEVEVYIVDQEGRPVPKAEVTLVNRSYHNPIDNDIIATQTAAENGKVEFSELKYKTYNFTVNYTIQSTGIEKTVFNSNDTQWKPLGFRGYNFSGLHFTIYLEVNMTTIDFEIIDQNEEALTAGFVLVYNEKNDPNPLANLTLDNYGFSTFRWGDRAYYYYEVYYDNEDYHHYTGGPKLLNYSYYQKSDFIDDNYHTKHDINIFEDNLNGDNEPYRINYYLYTTNDSSNGVANDDYIVNKKLINCNISLQNLDVVDKVQIYYINRTGGEKELEELGIYQTQTITKQNIHFKITNLTDSDLITDNYEIYGLRVYVLADNDTSCTGSININFTSSWRITNKTRLSKLNIQVVNIKGGGDWTNRPVEGVIVHIINKADKKEVVNLTTNNEGNAFDDEKGNPFWYLVDEVYNFTLEYYLADKFYDVNESDQYKPKNLNEDNPYNYTLTSEQNLIFNIKLTLEDFQTSFVNSTGPTQVQWDEDIQIRVNFSSTDDGGDTWKGIDNAEYVRCNVKVLGTQTIIKTIALTPEGDGNYSLSINSRLFSSGTSFAQYMFTVVGYKRGYSTPDPESFAISIYASETDIQIYNDTTEALFVNDKFSEYFNEIIPIKVKYINTSESSSANIDQATLTWEWQFESSQPVSTHNQDFYRFEINTSKAEKVGTYPIYITAYRENYTKLESFRIDIEILKRPAKIKAIEPSGKEGSTKVLHVAKTIFLEEKYSFEFEYNDTLPNVPQKISDATTAAYDWYKLDTDGKRIAGFEGDGLLNETLNDTYELDFVSELYSESRSGSLNGSYVIFITLEKTNYELMNSIIDLTIAVRPTKLNKTDYTGKTEQAVLSHTIYTGDKINFTFDYTSTLAGDARLTIYMEQKGCNWQKLDSNENGTVELELINTGAFMLDFNTSYREAGDYQLVIYLKSTNHSLQVFTINLKIQIRQINFTLSGFTGSQISIKQGIKQTIELRLTDNSRAGAPLLGANVTLTIGGQTIILTDGDGDGVYTGTFDSSLVNTFLQQEALTGTIKVEKKNYETKEITVTVVVRMVDTPFLDGVPLFWVVIGIVLVGGIVGSLGTYRYIQVARIPKFIKKVKNIKKAINSEKLISETDLYPSKEEFIVKKLGNKWDMLGLSLADILGIEITKGKQLPDDREEKGTIQKKKVKPKKEKKQKEPKVKKEKAPKEKKPEKATEEDTKKPQGGADE